MQQMMSRREQRYLDRTIDESERLSTEQAEEEARELARFTSLVNRARASAHAIDAKELDVDAPEFRPCSTPGCTRTSLMPICYECHSEQERLKREHQDRLVREAHEREVAAATAAAEARALEASIPLEFRWSYPGAAELAARVQLRPSRKVPKGDGFEWVAPPLSRVLERIVAHPLFLTIWGPARTGKSSLAVAALRARGRGLFVPARDLAVARAQHKIGSGEAPLVTRCLETSLLVLDDLGEEPFVSSSPIAHVLKERFSREAPTWITTGLEGHDLVSRYGEGVKARLVDPPRAWILPMGPREKVEVK